jgi:hypothetical protein
MAKKPIQIDSSQDWLITLTQHNFLFRGIAPEQLATYLTQDDCIPEKLYASRPIYTAYQPDTSLEFFYLIVQGGPVIVRSAPLDRIIALTYPGGCFGLLTLDVSYSQSHYGFPSLVEAYKTTDVIKVPQSIIQKLHEEIPEFQTRYAMLLELREKFQYHLLNCSAYPPQAVAALLRALIYQERALGNQPQTEGGPFCFDLPVDIIARACQLNHRTVEQVLKGMIKVGLIHEHAKAEVAADLVQVLDPEGMKGVYGATRDKVSWWPLR